MLNVSEAILCPMKTGPYFGVEVEVEGEPPTINNRFWTTKPEHSLRGNGVEYVFKRPFKLPYAIKAINDLSERVEGEDLHFSLRTSVHTHVNVSDLYRDELASVMYLSYLMEQSLFYYSGDSRIGNKFCLSLRDCAEEATRCIDFLNKAKTLHANLCFLDFGFEKYSGTNISSIQTFGTIEYRMLQGSTDKEYLTRFVRAIYNIREEAIKMGTPRKIYNYLNRYGMEKLIRRVFKKDFHLFCNADVLREAELSSSLAIEFPFEYKEGTFSDSLWK